MAMFNLLKYLKLRFKKAEEGTRNYPSNPTSINAQHSDHLSLASTSRHFDSKELPDDEFFVLFAN